MLLICVFNRPGVASAVLQTPFSLIQLLTHRSFSSSFSSKLSKHHYTQTLRAREFFFTSGEARRWRVFLALSLKIFVCFQHSTWLSVKTPQMHFSSPQLFGTLSWWHFIFSVLGYRWMSFSPLNNASMTSVKMTGMINGSSQPATPPYVAMSAWVGSL